MQTNNQERPTISIFNDIKCIVVRFVDNLNAAKYIYVLNERRYDYQKDSNDPIISIYEKKLEEIISLEKKLDYLYMLVETLSKKRPELYIAEWVDKKIKQVEAEILSQNFITETNREKPNPTTDEPKATDDETTTIVTGKKGQENKRRITARQIGQIVDEYKWESGFKKKINSCLCYTESLGLARHH